jgi:N-acetylglucosaminyldiphosphoundecaprenol N-acetyl-beta-D-mannosaminyltransferase
MKEVLERQVVQPHYGIIKATAETKMARVDHKGDARDIAGEILRKYECGGIRLDVGCEEDYLQLIVRCITENRRVRILNHNMHGLYHYFTDARLREIYADSVVMIDGWWILAILKAHGYPVTSVNRMAWIDFIWPLLTFAERRRFRVFWLGNSPAVNEQGLRQISERLPSLMIAGHHGYFDHSFGSQDNREIVARINDFGTDICIVGMGTPLQELWMKSHGRMLRAPVMLMAGACLEFISGHAVTPPRWLGPLGLEWVHRFASDPRRFAFRYLVEPWRVLFEISKHDLADVSTRALGFRAHPRPERGMDDHGMAERERNERAVYEHSRAERKRK